tara:strand:- start:973 stop:2832 length:1860 start_codon:yes stop_codon:yes gene_type:complete
MLATAHSRSNLRVSGVEVNDSEPAAAATTLVNWVRSRMHNNLMREVELVANYRETYGWSCVFVGWDQQATLRSQKLSMEDIMAIASQSAPESILSELPGIISDKTQADKAAELFMAHIPGLKKRRANKLVKELRETGEAEFPQPYICKNEPFLVALKPYEEVSLPPETIDLQSARVVFRRQYMTEVDLRSKVTNEGWDGKFVEAALNTSGKQMNYLDADIFGTSGTASSIERHDHLVEIVWAYTRQLNEDGIPSIYCTVFCPLLGNLANHGENTPHAKHFMLPYAHNLYPFICFKRENVARRIVDSRGVPEIAATWQQEVKRQRDSIADSTSMETLPSLMVNKRLGLANKVGPAVQLPVTSPSDYQFLNPPPRPPQTAFNLIESINLQVDQYFGRANPKIPPTQTQLKQQRLVNDWLRCWTEVYRQMFVLCLQYYPLDELARITNTQAAEALTNDSERFDFVLQFSVAELDNDLVKERLGTIANSIVPLDVAGRIDRVKLVDKVLRAVAPESADELMVDQASASREMYDKVKNDIGLMMQGIEATYQDATNDPTSSTKMQFAQEIASTNPGVQQALQGNELFTQLFQKYVQNLEMGVMQQQNKQIGRIGVQPMTQGAVQ